MAFLAGYHEVTFPMTEPFSREYASRALGYGAAAVSSCWIHVGAVLEGVVSSLVMLGAKAQTQARAVYAEDALPDVVVKGLGAELGAQLASSA